MTPFLVAATNGNNEVVGVMLEHFKNEEKVRLWAAEDDNDRTAVHLIALKAHRQMDPKVVSEWVNALELIVEDVLLKEKMTGNKNLLKRLLNNRDESGNTALHFASKNGCKQITKILIDNGANLILKNEDERTALMNASKMDHWEIIEQLVVKNPSLLNDVDEHGDTALHLACLNGQY